MSGKTGQAVIHFASRETRRGEAFPGRLAGGFPAGTFPAKFV